MSLADRYRIEHEVGSGGMATVHLATDLRHGRKVAIKIMRRDLAEAIGRERFRREIEVAARLSHPHIVPLFDSGLDEGEPYYVMPYVAGESLRARLNRDPRLPLDEALRLAREIASAIGYAHGHGLVHRDIKPENILLSDGLALVADFGIVRESDVVGRDLDTRAVTGLGVVLGTPRYMSPEQASGGMVDARSDLYSLACVTYEMLAGRPPFVAATPDAVIRMHCGAEAPPVTAFRAEVSPGVAAVLTRALAKDPADRFASAVRFAEALAAAASGSGTTEVEGGRTPGVANNLPRPRTRFVGREAERDALRRLLEESRLLTITGIGGSGKTRLAIEVAHAELESFPDGAWFVDLAPVSDGSRVALVVAATLGLKEAPGTTALASVSAHLAHRRTLVVLDNCEHVLGAAGELVEGVLASGEAARFVVTSRQRLGVAGEQSFALTSLAMPEAGATDPREIERADAVRLFVDRARQLDARFAIDATNAAALAEICRRLDGIPLALELAAARTRMLSIGEIQSRLDDRFRLLAPGGAGSPSHPRTLREAIEWSYGQLAPADQRLLSRLAVFAGGWTLAGATQVAGGKGDEFELLDALTRLGEVSLVVAHRTDRDTTRYSMLETVRQYAADRLVDSGEEAEARTLHARWALDLAEEAARELTGPRQAAWLSRLDADRENLLAAHAWWRQADDGVEPGLRLAYALQLYWIHRGLLDLGYRITADALARSRPDDRGAARRSALYAAGQLGYFLRRFDEARASLEECLDIAREQGDEGRIASALRMLGIVTQVAGDPEAARTLYEEGLTLARRMGDGLRISAALNALAVLEGETGEIEKARKHYEEALALDRARGDRVNVANELINLAELAQAAGAPGRAQPMVVEALAIAEEMRSTYMIERAVLATAGLAASVGDWGAAARFRGAADALLERSGVARSVLELQALQEDRIRAALGAAGFAAAVAEGRAWPEAATVAETRSWLGG